MAAKPNVNGAAPTPAKEAPIAIGEFFRSTSVAQDILRTANYAANPREYLIDFLGHQTFRQRRHLLSLPDVVVRDMYGNGAHLEHLEHHLATLLGKQHGLFFLTGVQAQLVALKVHCDNARRPLAAWHVSSHLESAELGAYKELYGLDRVLLGDASDRNPTVAEIQAVLARPAAERPAVLVLEIPNRNFGCDTYSFAELETLSAACRDAGVKLHMDGARLWEIEPYYAATAGKTFADVCALFDSVYVSMYKALGGTAGALLASDDAALMAEAKVWQRRAGGNAVTLYYEVVDAERGFNENIGTFTARRQRMLDITAAVLTATRGFTNAAGKPIVRFNPETPKCCQVHTMFSGYTGDQLNAARDRVQERLGVCLYRYLNGKKTLDEHLKEKASKTITATDEAAVKAGPALPAVDEDLERGIEWWIGAAEMGYDVQLFVDAYVAFCEELVNNAK